MLLICTPSNRAKIYRESGDGSLEAIVQMKASPYWYLLSLPHSNLGSRLTPLKSPHSTNRTFFFSILQPHVHIIRHPEYRYDVGTTESCHHRLREETCFGDSFNFMIKHINQHKYSASYAGNFRLHHVSAYNTLLCLCY